MSHRSPQVAARLLDHLAFLYGEASGKAAFDRLQAMLTRFEEAYARPEAAIPPMGPADSILITYGDQVREPGKPPLQSLAELLSQHLAGAVSGVHVLPFFPYTSDDGFSVVDYYQVDPNLGSWDDMAALGRHFRLMFDAVINHISAESEWFQGFLRDDPRYRDYFIVVPPGADLSGVTRPRTLPLLTPFQTPAGEKLVWTTFSADQIDLNYANPEVLLQIVDVLLTYVARGASLIRLDAIAYLWKEIGTSCIHLEATHRVIQLFRLVLDVVAPGVQLITETNVPHAENISYFGDGGNEAQLVYQFPLAPLLLNAIQTGRAGKLAQWAASLSLPSDQVTFFNFTASHDGVGVMPARGILSEQEIEGLVQQTLAHGGYASFKTNPDGGQSVYELNISYFDALSDPAGVEPLDRQVDRFMLSQAIMLALVGVPGIYVHSLFGSRSWRAGAEQTGRHRTINRQKFDRATLEAELVDPQSLRARVFERYVHLLRQRGAHSAFHPHGQQQVVEAGEALFALWRIAPDGRQRVLCLHNVSDQPQFFRPAFSSEVLDLVSGERWSLTAGEPLTLQPYQVAWLRPLA